jgi:hypothetical protein
MSITTAQLLETLSQIPLELVGPVIGVVLLYAARRYLGGWPDLWRLRRIVLPIVGNYKDNPNIPDKTEFGLQEREFVGVVDAPPKQVRQFFRGQDNWWPAIFASIQYEMQNGERVYEAGTYARRPAGFTGMWQDHVRLTPRDGGAKTALWAHHERSPIASPKKHYNAVGWEADPGLVAVANAIGGESDFELARSARTQQLLE